MATNPEEILPDEQPQFNLDPVLPDALPIEETVPEEPVQVAALGGISRGLMGKAKKLAKEIEPEAEPKTFDPEVPLGKIVEGELVLQPIPEKSAKLFRETLDLPDDFQIQLPNLTRTSPDGSVVNIMNIEDGAKQWIENLHKIFDEQVNVAKRGERTLDQIAKSAKTLGMGESLIELLGRKPGEAFNAEQMYRAMWVRGAMATEMDRIFREGNDEELLQLLPIAASVEIQTSGAVAEFGRTGAVLAHAGKLNISDASIKKLPELIQAYGIKPETINDVRYAYLALPKTEQKMTYLRTLREKGLQAWAEAYLSSLLSAIPTHMINIIGNTIFGSAQIPVRFLAGGVGAIRQHIFRGLGGKDRVYMSESYEMLASLSDGVPTALRAAWKAIKDEEGTFSQPGRNKMDPGIQDKAISAEYWGQRPDSALGRFLDYTGIATRFMGSRMLLAEDEFAKGIAFHMDLKAQAKRTMLRQIEEGMSEEDAIKAGARILAGKDAEIVQSAQDFATRMTFQGDLGKIATRFQDLFSHPLMKIWVPFFRTPTNITKETIQMTPFAPFMPSGFWTDLRKGGAEADQAISRFVFGTGIFATVASLSTGEMTQGFRINGRGPKNRQAQEAWKRNGWIPYSFSLKQPDGSWKNYDYGRFAPVAGVIASAADYAHYSQYEDDSSVLEDIFLHGGAAIYNVLSEMPSVQGIFSLSEIAGSEFEDINAKFTRTYELLVKQFTGAAITSIPLTPTGSLTASVERTLNPLASNPKPTSEQTKNQISTSPAVKGFYEALNRAKSRSPFFSDEVEPKLSLWAKPMMQCESGGWCFISPIRISQTKGNLVDDTIANLGMGIRKPPMTQRGVKLTVDQHNEMLIRMNELGNISMEEEMENVILSWEEMTTEPDIGGPDGKLEQLKSVITRRKKEVLDEMFADETLGLQFKKDKLEEAIRAGRPLRQ